MTEKRDLKLVNDDAARLARLERQLWRERQARREAEAIAEKGLRELYESRQHLALLQHITEAANSAENVRAALCFAITEVCREMKWEYGNALLASDSGTLEFACDIALDIDGADVEQFVEVSRRCSYTGGQGLPGRVMSEKRAQWIDDTGEEAGRLRSEVARHCGLQSACAFPVLIGEEVVGVLEFFSRRMMMNRNGLAPLMEQIGVQLGRVVERERNDALLHDARHDPLTGLPNRVLLAEESNAAFGRLASKRRERLAMLVLDLDGFKAVNDRNGHHAGDELLVAVAGRLGNVVREWREQVRELGFSCRTLVARTGGDEFVIMIDGIEQDAVIATIATRLHRALETPFGIEGEEIDIAVSIGIARCTSDCVDVSLVQRNADLAMYEAKALGRGRTMIFTPELGISARKRRDLEAEMREAVLAHEFVPHYQPIYQLGENAQIVGYEALARWEHPEHGLLEPAEFIDIAEETGIIVYIGDQILREACRAVSRLREECHEGLLPFVAVNIAPQQFLQRNFVDQLMVVLRETGVEPNGLRLEITESVAILDPRRTAEVLSAIRDCGVHTSLDDFGTGYSSLSSLQSLPLDSLKIDRSFVRDLGDERSMSIVQTILDLAKRLDLAVIAEGIETPAQLKILEGLGCRIGQGFLFARPMPEAMAFARYLPDPRKASG